MLSKPVSKSVSTALTVLLLVGSLASASDDDANPSIAGGVPFFYYADLNAAEEWYENKLGLKKVTDEDWVVIFQLADAAYIGLVNATGGSLRPTKEKGAMLSVETGELQAWYDKLKDVEGINMTQGIEEGAGGMIDEFRLEDPGGYIVEFFQWREGREEAKRYRQ